MLIRNLHLFVVLILISVNVYAQNIITEVGIGIGSINSNAVPQTTLDLNLSLKYPLTIENDIYIKAGYFNSKKIEFYLPENREGKYYPEFKGFFVSAEVVKPADIVDMSFQAGVTIFNDKMFADRNNWIFGLIAGGGIYLLGNDNPFLLKLDFDYALAFDKNSAYYYSAYISAGYKF